MPQPLRFTISAESASCGARLGRVETPHGSFDTPAFMPVGTRGTVKGLLPDAISATGTQILLNNAYHLMLRPGAKRIAEFGGVHEFMRWNGPILTDSGGYQAFSMADINAIDDEGVTFKSIIDGASVHLSPERSIEVQNDLGADIIMAFDDCPPSVDPDRSTTICADHRKRLEQATERTARWLERCVAAHSRVEDQALFGIVQGGSDHDLRQASVEAVCGIDLPGYAIGGVAVGEGAAEIRSVVEFAAPLLPADRPRYLMGVGYEYDLLHAIRAGVDMFDCVLPTRHGRNAQAFTRLGRLHLRNSGFQTDAAVIESDCDCQACAGGFSRAYLRHLFMSREMLGPVLVSMHNIRHFQRLLLDIRRAIGEDSWSCLPGKWPVVASPDAKVMSPPASGDRAG